MNIWVASTLGQLWVLLLTKGTCKCWYEHMSSILLGISVEFLGQIITLCFTFPKRLHHFTFPPARYKRFQFLHILSICYCTFFSTRALMSRYGLICTSLKANEVEHFLYAYWSSSLWKCLLKIVAHILNRLSFLLLNCKSSLYIQNSILLSNVWFASIFSNSVDCLFTFWIWSKWVFNLD